LGQITEIRSETEVRIKQAMQIKHKKESDELED
jgi:hypothetical protein